MGKKNAGIESPDVRVNRKRGMYWQTNKYNLLAYQRYLDQIEELALNRFRWLNLPAGVDERYLEWCLLQFGEAVIFGMPNVKGRFYGTKVVRQGQLNVYDNPTKFRSIGNNGWNVNLSNRNGVIVYSTRNRKPIWPTLEYYARRMADIDRTIDINLKKQKHPYIITGPEEKQQEITQFYAQVDGNEDLIVGLDGMNDLEVKAINVQVPLIAIELQQSKREMWNEMLEFLGIESANTNKRERLIQAEIEANTESCEIMRLSGLNARRDACAKLNKLFGLDMDVVWRKDLSSDNFNYSHNLEKKETGGIDDGGT